MDRQRPSAGVEYLASRLRQAWKESGLSLPELGVRAKWYGDRAYLSRAFNGEQTLALPLLERVAGALGLDYRALLAEAGLDEATYRSRHTGTPRAPAPSRASDGAIGDILVHELEVVRQLKHAGKPEEARGAIGAVERMVRHLGGLPAEERTVLPWAALLCERVGIAQDVQLPHTVLRTAERDLTDIDAIAREYHAGDLGAVGHFYAGDAHFKDQDYAGAIAHYECSAAHAPTVPLKVRSLTGVAIALVHVQGLGDRSRFRRLRGQIEELLSSGPPEELPEYVWDSEGWLVARFWSEITLAWGLVILGERREAAQQIEVVAARYERSEHDGFVSVPIAMGIAKLRFLAACEGVFDMSERDILDLGRQAHRLAEEGYCRRFEWEIEDIMSSRFGVQRFAKMFE